MFKIKYRNHENILYHKLGYLVGATKHIIDYALNNGTNTIVIDKDKGLKRSSNMGKRNNRNFIGIPHQVIVNILEYKARMVGINVIKNWKSYIS